MGEMSIFRGSNAYTMYIIIIVPGAPLRLELLHDVKEVVVDLRLVPELQLDLVQIRESILHFQTLELTRR